MARTLLYAPSEMTPNRNTLLSISTLSAFLFTSSVALAQDPEGPEAAPEGDAPAADGDASVSLGAGGLSGDADGDAKGAKKNKKAKDRGDRPWIKRWAPEPMMGELGIYGGVFFPNKQHELFDPDLTLPEQGYQRLNNAGFDIGARAGFYPIRFFGVEAEGGAMPVGTKAGESATLWTVRGSVVGQLGLWSVTPFVLAGVGALGVRSDAPPTALGNDVDPAVHFGGGVKVYVNRWVNLRLDVRDVLSHEKGVDDTLKADNLEVLLGINVTLGRKKDEPVSEPAKGPVDTDGDGIYDDVDACIDAPETFNDFEDEDGCPEIDTDGDGFLDHEDQCVDDPETVNDYKDEDGCPEKDTDGDGFWDEDDKCIEEPETKNGFEDNDGCPDEVPEEIAAFSGVIEGIYFDTAKDTIKKKSRKKLDEAVEVLKKFPDLKIRVNGHTDNQGGHDYNVDLSQRRADSVKQYMVDAGIDASRIQTKGHGPDKPIADNKTGKGRAKNRRIEFELIQ